MEYERAQGAVTQAEGAVRAATTVAGESIVRAPFTGRVVDTLVDVGDLAAPGRPLVRVESTAGRQFWVTVREADIVLYDPHGKHIISVDTHHMDVDYSAFEGWEMQGRVDTVLSKGKVIISDDTYHGQAGDGEYLRRFEIPRDFDWLRVGSDGALYGVSHDEEDYPRAHRIEVKTGA